MSWRASLLVVGTCALLVGGCSDENPVAEGPKASTESGPAAPSTALAPSQAGVIEARVTYAGAPDVETIEINKDVAKCGRKTSIEKIAVGEHHGLSDAVVSVADVNAPPASSPEQLDQRGCEFEPHVVAMHPGEIKIVNDDGVLHNIHTYSDTNPPINKAQPGFKKVMTESLEKPEVVRVTCDVHSWMQGWIVVLKHPFGVTGDDGVTRIEGVPPGAHTVDVWHEELGQRSKHDVMVKAGETTTVVFAYPKKKE